jgi:hypothetical protein
MLKGVNTMNLQPNEVTTHGGPEAQEVWDFSALQAIITAVDPQSPWIEKLQGWANILAIAITTGQSPEFTPVDDKVLTETVAHIIDVVAGSNHPIMLARFQEYARLTLSPEGFAEVVGQQITYDFDQILRFAAAYGDTLKAEIDRYLEMVLDGERFQTGEDFSREFDVTILELSITLQHRSRLIARINGYITGLEAQTVLVDDGDNDLALVSPDDDATGGLPTNLLAAPPIP